MTDILAKFCIDSLENYYKYGKIDFFDYLDNKVVFYGPVADRKIEGKQNLVEYFSNEKRTLKFNVENISVKLFPLKAQIFMLLMAYELYIFYPDGKIVKLDQHMIIVSKRKQDSLGNLNWLCSFIHVSNSAKKGNGSGASPKFLDDNDTERLEDIFIERNSVKKIVLSGEENSKYFIAENSIKFIEGGKGVKCFVHTDKEVLLVNQLMKSVYDLLPKYYYRCHSSFIINLNRVKSIGNYSVTLDSGEIIPIPAKKYTTVKSEIERLISMG